MAAGWHIWIDRGGTFTDVVALTPQGQILVRKVLSVQPGSTADPAVQVITELLGSSGRIADLRLGTTVATNALLEGAGTPVLLLINRGLADLLRIGDLHRPDLFALAVRRPDPLAMRVVEVGGRLAADGVELEPLALDQQLRQSIRDAMADGYSSVAIALLHSTRNPDHELQLADWLAPLAPDTITLSHRLSALPRLVPRGQTALVEAAVAPVLRRYFDQVEQALGDQVPLRIMRSSGALVPRPWLLAKDTVLSGPAGGMVGAIAVAQEALQHAGLPLQPVVGFDMGGTSTDVFHAGCRDGGLHWQRSPETAIAGLQLQAPMLPIHTVAAGGGSILRFVEGRLQVGPGSAGADPGPAAYRRGGPLTITDANVLLGRLPAQALPPLFGPQGDQPLDTAAVQQGFAELQAAMAGAGVAVGVEDLADGALRIAVETMAAAIRRISLEQGHDPRSALLVSFGGAAAQHACRLAAELGIQRVLVHPLAGVLSAYGIGRSPQSLLLERVVALPLTPETLVRLDELIGELQAEGSAQLAQVVPDAAGPPLLRVRLELRQPCQERGLELPWPRAADRQAMGASQTASLSDAYAVCHQQRYGYRPAAGPLVVERLLLELEAVEQPAAGVWVEPSPPLLPVTTPLWTGGAWQSVPLIWRPDLDRGQRLRGPALVLDATTTLVLEPLWQLQTLADGALLLEAPPVPQPAGGALWLQRQAIQAVDPVLLELYHHRFAAIAVQMGQQLQQSARSLNMRERLDYSCALFDGKGRLVANAPHIPVHLGSMGESVTSLLAAVASGARRPLVDGDVVLANNPYNGGTHLPDITAITPLFAPGAGPDKQPVLFVACRGHHADVGGITPGSMPADSRSIDDEGLLLDNLFFLDHGVVDEPWWRQRLAAGPHPVRNPDLLLADLQAQVAANRRGVLALAEQIERHGLDEVLAYMGHVQSNAAAAVRRLIARLLDGSCTVALDHGGCIAVAVQVDRPGQRLRIDCSGTSAQHPGNLNAPLAVTRAVVLYVLRALVGEPIPLNAGCFEPIDLVVPPGSLLNPNPPAAVVAGNVEISQALANALLAALGAMAGSQGTMNNLTFGNHRHQYYETIGGGAGAGPGFVGCGAVQTHMTNSRLTDPEVLEARLPVRLEHFAIRHGSGGVGRWSGGDGVVRQLRFLEPVQVSLISGSRLVPPPGLAGGQPGQCGRNLLLDRDGNTRVLPGCCELALQAGDGIRIETPGGGGYGLAPA
ncbi:MAG: hydantoinase B/oxoprolinase family protein [Cyanobacteria bacterium REEB417]|nr:hydantoinase B/oxoprolinase family protein [Cyanobacteria bacterium REEB417]